MSPDVAAFLRCPTTEGARALFALFASDIEEKATAVLLLRSDSHALAFAQQICTGFGTGVQRVAFASDAPDAAAVPPEAYALAALVVRWDQKLDNSARTALAWTLTQYVLEHFRKVADHLAQLPGTPAFLAAMLRDSIGANDTKPS